MFPKKKKNLTLTKFGERCDSHAFYMFIFCKCLRKVNNWKVNNSCLSSWIPGLVLDLYHCFNVFVFHFEEYVRRLVEIDVQVKTIIIKAELILEIPGGLDRKTFLRCEGQKHLASSPHKRGHKKRARNCCSFASQPTHKYTHAHTHSHAHTNGQQVSAVSKPL